MTLAPSNDTVALIPHSPSPIAAPAELQSSHAPPENSTLLATEGDAVSSKAARVPAPVTESI